MIENSNDLLPDVEIPEDDFDLSGERKIYTTIGDPEIKSLHDKHKKGRLDIRPDFQRQFVWNLKKSSQLIESAMLSIPLPIIYLSEEPSGKVAVIDGQQRLTAFFSFIDGRLPDGKEFRLSGLKVFKDYERKKYSELPEKYQEKIAECKIRTITFTPDSYEDLKFEIFERLNSGSVKLNDQELRNCIYRGRYNKLLQELSQDSDFMKIMGYDGPDKRMRDVEYVLRFAAFFHQAYLNYKDPMKKFMNKEMEEKRNISEEDSERLKKAFKNSVSIIFSLLGKNAFRKFVRGDEQDPNGHWGMQTINASLYDILMWSFANKDKNLVMSNLDSIKEELINLMTFNEEFINSIEYWTSGKLNVQKRFDIWRNALDAILANQIKQPRCFSYSLKKELYDEESTCQICGNEISHIDDAAIDHINQYWLGGKTIPENARLTHRYCNWARSRKG